ncbi:hypothetical protein MKEN_00294600 [Mycena kentingensis (nom. inval.)]|nr:hypothetical protein MKEN_00294600 [Mycena kentingensis (nom. inval.)]
MRTSETRAMGQPGRRRLGRDSDLFDAACAAPRPHQKTLRPKLAKRVASLQSSPTIRATDSRLRHAREPSISCSPIATPHAALHPYLSNQPGTSPYIDWDISTFPTSARLSTRTPVLAYQNVPLDPYTHAPAVLGANPPHIDVYFGDTPELGECEAVWGPIRARSLDSVRPGEPITIADVLDAVYEYFHEPLRGGDMIMAMKRPRVMRVAQPRLGRRPQEDDILRCDVLKELGMTRFGGLQMWTGEGICLRLLR